MNATELQQFFPLVPLVILDKYAKYFACNVSQSEIFSQYAREYSDRCNMVYSQSEDGNGNIFFQAFNPVAAYAQSVNASTSLQVAGMYHEYIAQTLGGDRVVETSQDQWTNIPIPISLYFDSRLGSFSAPRPSVEVVGLYPAQQGGFTQNYVYRGMQKLLDRGYYYQYRRSAAITFNAASFSGLQSLIVAMENGIAFTDLEYTDAVQAMTYIKAVSKYALEIKNSAEVATQKAKYEINDVMRAAKDSFSRDIADLSQKKLAIVLAVQNEEKSALRDMQNLLLNAQSIKL